MWRCWEFLVHHLGTRREHKFHVIHYCMPHTYNCQRIITKDFHCSFLTAHAHSWIIRGASSTSCIWLPAVLLVAFIFLPFAIPGVQMTWKAGCCAIICCIIFLLFLIKLEYNYIICLILGNKRLLIVHCYNS